MKNKIDLIEYIKSFKRDSDILITTYAYNQKFFENHLFSRFEDNTFPLILVDYHEYQENVLDYGESKLIESKYFIEPIKCAKIFHPKLLLTIDEENINCIIGSNNLTFGGYVKNLEILFNLKLNIENKVPYKLISDIEDFLKKLTPLIKSQPHQEKLKKILSSLRSKIDSKKFSEEKNRESWIIHNLDRPIYSQILQKISGNVKEIYVISPFYSDCKNFYQEVLDDCEKINFLVQQENTNLPKNILKDITHVNFYELRTEQDRFVHAKLVYFVTEDENYLFGGSANFTKPALLKQENIELGVLTKIDMSFNEVLEDIGKKSHINLQEIKSASKDQDKKDKTEKKFRLIEVKYEDEKIILKTEKDINQINNIKIFINEELKEYPYEIKDKKIIFKIPSEDQQEFKSSAAVNIQVKVNGKKDVSDYRLIHNRKLFPANFDELNQFDIEDDNYLFNILKKLSKKKNLANFKPVLEELSGKSVFSREDKEKSILELKNKIKSIEPSEKDIDLKQVIQKIIKKKQKNIERAIDHESVKKDFEVINTFVLLNKLILYSSFNDYYPTGEGLGEIRINIEKFFNQDDNYLDILLNNNRKRIIEESDLGFHLAIISFIIHWKQNKKLKKGKITKNVKKVFDKSIIKSLKHIRNKTKIEYDLDKVEDYLQEYQEILPALEEVDALQIKKDLSSLLEEYERRDALDDSYY